MKHLYPLTEAEQAFATEHFALIGSFLRRKQLPEDDWFDVAVFGFLEAVQTQFYAPCEPERQNFPALARICMEHAVAREWRYRYAEKRRGEALSLDTLASAEDDDFSLLDILFDEKQDVARMFESKELLTLAHSRGRHKEKAAMDLLAAGYDTEEAAEALGVSLRKCKALLRGIRRKTERVRAEATV